MSTILHYAKEPFEFDHERSYEINKHQEIGKPGGFWWSVGDDWQRWCEAEDFGIGEYAYRVILTPDAKILRLTTVDEILAFTERYAFDGFSQFYKVIGWHLVQADGYQGVEIAPYQWKLRLDRRTHWYYSWDCASGVAWDPKAIEQVVPE